MKLITELVTLAVALVPTIAHAQDQGAAEVIVSAMRRDANDYSADMPAVGLRRTADFAIQEVTIAGDTRDAGQRADEIYAMLANAIAGASRAGVQLAYGDRVVQAVTLKNYRDLSLERDSRPDSQRLKFLVKAPLTDGTEAASAQARINAFVKSVKPVGRALMEANGDLTLSVVAPDQYRGAIADAIAMDARTLSARFGPDYAVEVEGLNRPVEWARASLSEVLLYIPYKLVIVPKP